MIKFLLIDRHDIMVFPLMLSMTLDTIALDPGMKAFIYSHSFGKLLVACCAGRIRDALSQGMAFNTIRNPLHGRVGPGQLAG